MSKEGWRVSRSEPEATGRWIVWARPQGTWLISDAFPSGYLRLDEQGHVDVVNYGRDERSYWDVEQIWRVKVSDNPASNSPWRRRHVPGPD